MNGDCGINPFQHRLGLSAALFGLKLGEKSEMRKHAETPGIGGKMVQSEAADGSAPSFQDPAQRCQTGTGAGESRK